MIGMLTSMRITSGLSSLGQVDGGTPVLRGRDHGDPISADSIAWIDEERLVVSDENADLARQGGGSFQQGRL